MDFIVSRRLSSDRLYAYCKKRFWIWDDARCVWKESHLMSQKYEREHAARAALTPEQFMTGDEFIQMDDYELPDQTLTALRDAKPCKNAPIDPAEEDSSSGVPAPCICSTCTCSGCKEECFGNCRSCGHPVQECNSYQTEDEKHLTPAHSADVDEPEVPDTQTAQDKPLTTIPDEMRPAFDYSGLDEQTVDDLHFAEKEYQHGKKLAERGLIRMCDAIAVAHEALCGVVAQCDNSKHGNRGDDTFRAWCVSIGITKDTAYRLLQVAALLDGSSPRQQKILKELSPTLLYAVAKPSAPAELVEQVKSGDITTNKQYQEALAQLKAEKDRANAAEAREEEARKAAHEYHEKYEEAAAMRATLLDQQGAYISDVNGLMEQNAQLKKQTDAAEARAKDAENQLEGSRQVAEAAKLRGDKLKAENDALKKQPITAVVDEEEVDRRAKALAHQWDEEELDRLAAEKAWGLADARNSELAKDNTALRKQLAALRAKADDDAQADFESANFCVSLIRSAWDANKASYSRLTGEDLESTFQALCGVLNGVMEEASRLLQISSMFESSSPRQQDILQELPPSLLYAAAKPSAPPELVGQVKSGDITSFEEHQESG